MTPTGSSEVDLSMPDWADPVNVSPDPLLAVMSVLNVRERVRPAYTPGMLNCAY